jgi:hypothetical protein
MTRLLSVLAVLLMVGQTPAPNPTHGPYANQDGVKCYRGDTRDLKSGPVKKLVHCGCKLHCDEHGNQQEANDCQTFCDISKKQCLCHTDEACDAGGEQ